jgi:hypothetical protein
MLKLITVLLPGLLIGVSTAQAETHIVCKLERSISDKAEFNGPTSGEFSATLNEEARSIRLNSSCKNPILTEFSNDSIILKCDDEIFSSSYSINRISGEIIWSLFPKKNGGFLMHFGHCQKTDKAF